MKSVIDSLLQTIECNEAESMAFQNILRLKTIKKSEPLLLEGEVCNYGVFISQGCLRYYYMADGVESTGSFFFENDWYSDFQGFLYGKPSLQNIEALEDSVLYLAYKSDFDKLVAQYPIFNDFLKQMMERCINGLTRKSMSMTLLSPEDRYLRVIKHYPKVIERVSLKYIASYLGVKPESLSRIRTRLTLNSKS